MATREITSESLREAIGQGGIVVLDWWASWCGPCRMFAPTFEQVSEHHPEVIFGKVDTEAQSELAAAFQIMSIPTLMVLRENVLLYCQSGALPAAALEQIIEKAKALDMDEVRRQIAAHENAHPPPGRV